MSPDDQRRGRLQVTVTDGRGRPLRKPGLTRWLCRVAPTPARGGVAVALVSDGAMRRLNSKYAAHDYATDVLSFPGAVGPSEASAPPSALRLLPHLGDIVIATGVASRQAKRAGHPMETELRILALHGLLHLVGFDHATDDGRMARIEARLRRQGGLEAGLIERADVARRAPERGVEGRKPVVPRSPNGGSRHSSRRVR